MAENVSEDVIEAFTAEQADSSRDELAEDKKMNVNSDDDLDGSDDDDDDDDDNDGGPPICLVKDMAQLEGFVKETQTEISKHLRYPHHILTNQIEANFYALATELQEEADYGDTHEDGRLYFRREAAAARDFGMQIGTWAKRACGYLEAAQRLGAKADEEFRKLASAAQDDEPVEQTHKSLPEKSLTLAGISTKHQQHLMHVLVLMSASLDKCARMHLAEEMLMDLRGHIARHPECKYSFGEIDLLKAVDLHMMTELTDHRQSKMFTFVSSLKTATQREVKESDLCPICGCKPLESSDPEDKRVTELVYRIACDGNDRVEGEFFDFPCSVGPEEGGLVLLAGKDRQDVVVDRKCLLEWFDNSSRCPLTNRILF